MLAFGIPQAHPPLPEATAGSGSGPGLQAAKRKRAACEECRTKKLKCTGELPTCSRCEKENITCVYSEQKRMGRPKKRQRTEDEPVEGRRSRKRINRTTQQTQMSEAEGLVVEAGQDTAFEDSSYLTPGGSLKPWLQTDDWTIPAEANVPDLTSDSSSGSPPTLNLPPELQSTVGNTHSNPAHGNHNTPLLLDPSLAATGFHLGVPSTAMPDCACLSAMYLTLNTLQTMDTTCSFPFALHPLREAMQTASEVLTCEQCPTKFLSAIQNTQMVGTLLMSLADRFGKILESITAESDRAEAQGETRKFRLADLSTSTAHLHTGGIGCAAAFDIDLSASEWRSMSKKVVRAEVHGPLDENSCCPSMISLVEQLKTRHERGTDHLPKDFPKDPATGLPMGGKHIPKSDHVCLKLAAYARKLVEGYDWS